MQGGFDTKPSIWVLINNYVAITSQKYFNFNLIPNVMLRLGRYQDWHLGVRYDTMTTNTIPLYTQTPKLNNDPYHLQCYANISILHHSK